MKKTKINIEIDLDEQNVPEKISWEATDDPNKKIKDARTMSVSFWDHVHKNTLRIDLWTKEMEVEEMKRFAIDCMGGLAQTILSATGDEYMSNEINTLCDKLVEHVKKEE
jgi:gliding motility-associated protein GldC